MEQSGVRAVRKAVRFAYGEGPVSDDELRRDGALRAGWAVASEPAVGSICARVWRVSSIGCIKDNDCESCPGSAALRYATDARRADCLT